MSNVRNKKVAPLHLQPASGHNLYLIITHSVWLWEAAGHTELGRTPRTFSKYIKFPSFVRIANIQDFFEIFWSAISHMWNSWSLETHDTHKLALWCSAFSVPFNILAPQCRVCIQEGVPARKSHIYLPLKWPKNIKKCLTYVLAECHVWWYVNTGGLTVSLRKAAPVGEVGRGKGHQGREDEEKKGEKGEGGERRRGIVTHDDSTCHPFWIKAHPSIYRSPFPLTITRIRFKNRNPPLVENWLKAILNTDSGFDCRRLLHCCHQRVSCSLVNFRKPICYR